MIWKSKHSNKHKIVYCCHYISTDPSEDKTISERFVEGFSSFSFITQVVNVWSVSTVFKVSLQSDTHLFLLIIHGRLSVAMEGKSVMPTMQWYKGIH